MGWLRCGSDKLLLALKTTSFKMAELFDSYSSDFTSLCSSISSKISDLSSQSGEPAKATMRRAEMEIEEAEEIISQMEIEVAGFPQSVRSRYAVRLRGSQGELTKLRKELVSEPEAEEEHVDVWC